MGSSRGLAVSGQLVEATARTCMVVVALASSLFLEGSAAAMTAAGESPSVQRVQQVRSLLRRLNKPPLATIQSPDGDIIDCVHISKQPAFDHPLLKNHTIQMRPSSYPPGGLYNVSHTEPPSITQIWHQNGKCPESTIPIRRTKQEDVLRASSIRRYGKKRPGSIPNISSVGESDTSNALTGHQHAVASARDGNSYYGTKATFNLWRPELETENDFSLTQLWISSGSYDGNNLNTIEAGWQVYPSMYNKDSNPRLFIYWTRDAYTKTGCYNLGCSSGFIQTNSEIAIGGSLSPVSVYGGSQYEIDILAWKDQKGGNWWLQVGGSNLGYWPSSIFSRFTDGASSVQWGGEVFSSDAGQTSTQMGSGHFPEEGFRKASYIRNIQVVGSSNYLKPPRSVGILNEHNNCYNAQNGVTNNWGTYIYYGGPGKNPNCP